MKDSNLAFQLREAYWQSKARLLVEWLLKRLGIFLGRVAEEFKEGASDIFFAFVYTIPLLILALVLTVLLHWLGFRW